MAKGGLRRPFVFFVSGRDSAEANFSAAASLTETRSETDLPDRGNLTLPHNGKRGRKNERERDSSTRFESTRVCFLDHWTAFEKDHLFTA